MNVNNELESSAFVSYFDIQVNSASSPLIELKPQSSHDIRFIVRKPGKTLISGKPLKPQSSHDIRFTVRKPGKTLISGKPKTLTLAILPGGSKISGWHLKLLMLAQIRCTRKGSLATTWLEGIAEYGIGQGENEAILDLVDSLGEYRESLEKREGKLGDSARRELDYLRRLIEREPGNLT